jgi:hypothetical protein
VTTPIGAVSSEEGAQQPGRHPLDPDPMASTKATAVLVLGVLAVIMAPLVGGAIPAAIALVLADQARREITASRGYLTGLARVNAGQRLAWVAIILAVIALVVAAVIGILGLVNGTGQDFPSTSN